ncbi:MAG: ATP-binding protein [Rhodospirillaceae bacterium]
MTISPVPLKRLILPGLLMLAPLVALLPGVADTAEWVEIIAALLPSVGAFRLITLYRRELDTLTESLQRKADKRYTDLATRLQTGEVMLEALHDPLIAISGARRVRYANQAARTLFGEQMADADLSHGLRHPEIVGAVDAVLAGGASRAVEFTLPGTVECVYHARIKPFRRPGDSEALILLHDITKMKRSEQQRADFVANASHELRTPLASLTGFIETLRGAARDDADARERFLGIMHEQAGRMGRLVDDLLSLSRIELDEHIRPGDSVDVLRCVGAAMAAFELKAAARRVRLRISAADGLQPVPGDSDQLTQVMYNLISNAVKYTREQTEVTITISTTSRMVMIAVADRGEGISRTHLPRLTERFYRVDPARSRALGGTGLGLAIVKHILNRHRGRLIIESEPGQGATFTVQLPIA